MSYELMWRYDALIKESYKDKKIRKSMSFKHNTLSKSYQEALAVAINEIADQIINIKKEIRNL